MAFKDTLDRTEDENEWLHQMVNRIRKSEGKEELSTDSVLLDTDLSSVLPEEDSGWQQDCCISETDLSEFKGKSKSKK